MNLAIVASTSSFSKTDGYIAVGQRACRRLKTVGYIPVRLARDETIANYVFKRGKHNKFAGQILGETIGVETVDGRVVDYKQHAAEWT